MIHGGAPDSFARARGLKVNRVIDFSVNLNPLGPPRCITKALEVFYSLIPHYPPIDGDGVVEFYEKRFGLKRDMLLGGNGSTEFIYLLPRALKFKTCLIFSPTYYDYQRASRLAGAEVMTVTLDENDNFSILKVKDLFPLVDHVDAVWICRPNNPTGTILDKEPLLELTSRYPDKFFILDESFIQFLTNFKDQTFLTPNLPENVIVIHSLTKFYSLAGLRLGGLYAHDTIIERLKILKEPWSVNALANFIAPLLAEDLEYEENTRELVAREREYLARELSALKTWQVYESGANFLLLKWLGELPLDNLLETLYKHGVFVRDARNFEGLEAGFIRIGIKNREENSHLISAIRRAIFH